MMPRSYFSSWATSECLAVGLAGSSFFFAMHLK